MHSSPRRSVSLVLLILTAGCGATPATDDASTDTARADASLDASIDVWPPDTGAIQCNDGGHGVTLGPCTCGAGEHCAPVRAPIDWNAGIAFGSMPGRACVADAATPGADGDACDTASVTVRAHVNPGCSVGPTSANVPATTSTCGPDLVCVMGVCRAACDPAAMPSSCTPGADCTLDSTWGANACTPPASDAGGLDAGTSDAG